MTSETAQVPHQAEDYRNTARAILSANGVRFRRLTRLVGGARNIVFRVDKDCVLRFAREDVSDQCLLMERTLQELLPSGVPLARVLKSGVWYDVAYQLREFVPGTPFALAWKQLDRSSRAHLVAEFCGILQYVHSVRFADYGSLCRRRAACANWLELVDAELDDVPALLAAHPTYMHRVSSLRSAIRDSAGRCLWCEAPCLTHNDLYLTNVIVRKRGIAALIDWELAMKAPIDLDAYKLEYFCRRPTTVKVSGDFRELWKLLVRQYPLLFSHPDLHTRLGVYDLLASWRMFVHGIRMGESPARALQCLEARVSRILAGKVRRWRVPDL